ncbi:MAG: hypothetical protein Q6373_017040 [Candidatus Sigynarchaeota archaeon]
MTDPTELDHAQWHCTTMDTTMNAMMLFGRADPTMWSSSYRAKPPAGTKTKHFVAFFSTWHADALTRFKLIQV